MRSLRGRLLALWLLLLASAAATGLLLVVFYRQSAAQQVAQTEAAAGRACRDIAERYAFLTAGWGGPAGGAVDAGLRRDLDAVVQVALRHAAGIEGGIWQAAAGSLAYAFPTYEGSGPKTDLPAAEIAAIAQANAEALRDDRPVLVRRPGRTQALVLHACPLPGPVPELTAWAMGRAFTGQGPAYDQLLLGLGLLTLTVLGSAAFLGRLLYAVSGPITAIERALAAHRKDGGELPRLPLTGERELDRLVDALNAAGARLAQARRQAFAAERMAAAGRLAAGVAHEIRNPLAAMRLKAENALASPDPARARAALGVVLDQVARMDGLLRDLLNLTQNRPPRPRPVDLGALLARSAALHEDLARAGGVALTVEAPAPGARPVLDPEQIGRALDNLVLNAIQNAPGGAVRLSAAREAGRLRLRVADDGPGVPETVRGRLFEPFVTGRPEGSGLGLAIVREIAQAHGGEARLRPGDRGATFEIDLPETGLPEIDLPETNLPEFDLPETRPPETRPPCRPS
ncbi:Adaptive-response sensory-kinase SasA [Methylobacterium crusticola]|uniref:histidine kinase n=1 Tax=Methylobacterium crusticola TaxID=1697972 RepID=A0ABQ4QU98_9HYPH|nr:HAMP domain-containing sensor histidine kinase [Methylobacterium crusticola]GJD48915.1 Adaptive-response sensory-kinase SasA [Methylobacterium crusticola]